MSDKPIILFDGVCNLCNWSVQFIIKRDPKAYFRFASIQSTTGKQLLQERGVHAQDINSFVLIEGQSCLMRSDAALGVAKNLAGLWSLLIVLYIIPHAIRDLGYDLIARNRYKWFGKQNSCMIPSKELLDRFLG